MASVPKQSHVANFAETLRNSRTVPSILLSLISLVAILLLAHSPQNSAHAAGETVDLSTYLVGEGNDFASLNLLDPWDMDEFSDVSMYINESNVAIHLQNIQLSGGLFSAQSVGTDAQFHTLFPGYQSSIPAGKTGARNPIQSSDHCFFTLMQTDSADTLDEARVWWFEDNTLTGGAFGSGRLSSFPFAPGWQFYAADLNSILDTGTAWSGSGVSEWQGLRIDPTTKSSVDFDVDWVRLTDCAADPVTVTWSGISGAFEIWAGIGAAQPDFKVPDGEYTLDSCTASPCVLDVQGWQPGSYYIGVKRLSDGQFFWTSQPLVIDPVPIVGIDRPSFTSGQSIVWTMSGPSDIVSAFTVCVDYFFDIGKLDLVTQPPGSLPGSCVSSGNSDPQVVLSQNGDVDTGIYRYLTFQTSMDGSWQDVNLGWIVRWIWSPYPNCFQVSNDIPFDVGWQKLTIDLHDSFEGLAEDSAAAAGVSCPIRHWKDFPATYLRFDPNENRTSQSFHQRVDWIRLSAMDRIAVGSNFPIQLDSSENVDDLILNFYYTTDPDADPKQNVVILASIPPPPSGPFFVYLPMIFMDAEAGGSTYPAFLWDTSGVAKDQYHICVEASDGQNSAIFCSEAPVEVY